MNINLFKRDSYEASVKERALLVQEAIGAAKLDGGTVVWGAFRHISWEPNEELGLFSSMAQAEEAVRSYIKDERKRGAICGPVHLYVTARVLDRPHLVASVIRFEVEPKKRIQRVVLPE